jgi:hypothetical protein
MNPTSTLVHGRPSLPGTKKTWTYALSTMSMLGKTSIFYINVDSGTLSPNQIVTFWNVTQNKFMGITLTNAPNIYDTKQQSLTPTS